MLTPRDLNLIVLCCAILLAGCTRRPGGHLAPIGDVGVEAANAAVGSGVILAAAEAPTTALAQVLPPATLAQARSEPEGEADDDDDDEDEESDAVAMSLPNALDAPSKAHPSSLPPRAREIRPKALQPSRERAARATSPTPPSAARVLETPQAAPALAGRLSPLEQRALEMRLKEEAQEASKAAKQVRRAPQEVTTTAPELNRVKVHVFLDPRADTRRNRLVQHLQLLSQGQSDSRIHLVTGSTYCVERSTGR